MYDVYTHTWTCALRSVVRTGLYINTFPRHGYSMTFLFSSLNRQQRGLLRIYRVSSIFFLSPSFLIICVWNIIFAMARLAAVSMCYPVSLPTSTPFISVPFLPFRYFSSNSKGKRNRQSSFVLRRSTRKR